MNKVKGGHAECKSKRRVHTGSRNSCGTARCRMCAHRSVGGLGNGWVNEWQKNTWGQWSTKAVCLTQNVPQPRTNARKPGVFWGRITDQLPVPAVSLSRGLLAGAGNPVCWATWTRGWGIRSDITCLSGMVLGLCSQNLTNSQSPRTCCLLARRKEERETIGFCNVIWSVTLPNGSVPRKSSTRWAGSHQPPHRASIQTRVLLWGGEKGRKRQTDRPLGDAGIRAEWAGLPVWGRYG